jgi:dipeptidyl aminopeptidase/acylaminoacyl peptidase
MNLPFACFKSARAGHPRPSIASWLLMALCALTSAALQAQPAAPATAAAAQLPAEAFFQNPAVSGAVLSPSGTHVAITVGSKTARDRLAVLDLSTMKIQPVAAYTDADVMDVRWISDRRLVYSLADRRLAAADLRFARGLYAVNADGSEDRQLVQRERVWVRDNIGTRQLPWNTFALNQAGPQNSDSLHVVQPEQFSEKGADFFKLMRLDTLNYRTEDIDAPLNAFQWLLDEQGNLRAVKTLKGGTAALHWREPATGQWRKLREFDRYGLDGDLELQAVAPDNKLYVLSRKGRDTQALFVYDPATDTLADKPVVATAQYDVQPQLVRRQDKLVGVRFTVDAEVTQWLDPAMAKLQTEVDERLPSTANMLTPARRGDSPWVLVRAFADVQPTKFYIYNSQTRKLSLLGSQHPGINPKQMSAMDMVRYKARDGLEIPAYLTLPASAPSDKNLPLVVYVHGGPWVRGSHWHWQGDVQFLASRGYAVLQPEFRGSTGFGNKHFVASFKQWGLAMQDDLADAARWAVAQGIADPKRICIMGASYGGYATLMGLAKDGHVFKCGINWVGVSDILLMFDANWSDMSDDWKQFGMPRMIGDRQAEAAQLQRTSPINLAAQIKNPLLMAHGLIDRRVPIEHGRRMRDALKTHNPNVEWVEYEKDGHGWSLPETDVDWWSRIEKFLARHIGTPAP